MGSLHLPDAMVLPCSSGAPCAGRRAYAATPSLALNWASASQATGCLRSLPLSVRLPSVSSRKMAAAAGGGGAVLTNKPSPFNGVYTVGDFMTKKEDLQVVRPTTTIDEALELLVENRISGFPVIDDNWKLMSASVEPLSSSSNNPDGSDPNDKRPKDIGWKYGVPASAGISANVASCQKVPVEVRSEIRDYMQQSKQAKSQKLQSIREPEGRHLLSKDSMSATSSTEVNQGSNPLDELLPKPPRMKGHICHIWQHSKETEVGVVSDYDLLALDTISGGLRSDTTLFPEVDSSWKTFNEIQKLLGKTNGKVIGDLMTPAPLVVRETTNLEDAARLLLETKYRRLPVVDGDGKLVGILTRGSVVRGALQIKREMER